MVDEEYIDDEYIDSDGPDELEVCPHGVGFDEDCEDCEIEDAEEEAANEGLDLPKPSMDCNAPPEGW